MYRSGALPDSFRAPESKIVFVGDSGVGKTSILRYLLTNISQTNHEPTIGCNCQEVNLVIDGENVTLMAWDTAGQEVYRAIVPIYTRDAAAALIVYDVSSLTSFRSIEHWHSVVMEHQSSSINLYVVANKIDLAAAVPEQQARLVAEKLRASFHLVSAQTGEGVRSLFETVARDVLVSGRTQTSTIKLQQPSKSKGCC
jgi:small GTP-binding protein